MRRAGCHLVLALALAAVLASAGQGPAAATPATPARPVSPDISAAVSTACAARPGPGPCRLISSTSAALGRGVTEYTYLIRVGDSPYDRIALHRVVGGTANRRAVMMVHGDLWGFDAAFAGRVGTAERAPSVASYLARAGFDVWGIDLRWVLVPRTVDPADTGFMAGWGIATDLADLRLATTVERTARVSDRLGDGRTALLGWSRGGQLAYAYASSETGLPPADRNVSALVPVDIPAVYSPNDNANRVNNCRNRRDVQAEIDAGAHARDYTSLARWGEAALTAPDAPSTDYPAYTNREVALFVGGFAGFFSPWYHFVAESLDADGVPVSTLYTSQQQWFGLLTQVAPYEALALFADGAAVLCATAPMTFIRHLGSVTVPLLYVGAAGGFGTTGSYSTSLVASRDVSSLVVRLRPVGRELDDFGHVDLWQGTDADTLVWSPLASWLAEH